MNKDTYTPMEIEGKIYVVVDAPEKPNDTKPFDSLAYEIEMRYFDLDLAVCTKYPTLEQDEPYWKERIGQRVEVQIGELFKYHDGNYQNKCSICKEMFVGDKRQPVCKPCCETTYAIPPQQNQGDEWDEAERLLKTYACNADGNIGVLVKPIDIINIFKPHFNITKK